MAEKVLIDGNEAVARGAIYAGCKAFFGYPITPQSEVLEYMSHAMPEAGGVFLQTECELAASGMTYGANAAGVRAMTATSGPGFSLMQEFISHAAFNMVPMVIVDVMRLGPGVGAGGPGAQHDYRQATKGGGHGDYRSIVLLPYSHQEIFDFMQLAFHLADKHRMVVVVLTDFIMCRSMESVELRTLDFEPLPEKNWAVQTKEERTTERPPSHMLLTIKQRFTNQKEAYQKVVDSEVRYDTYQVEDAEFLLVSYGSSARMCRDAVDLARAEGLKVGLFRPITGWPFPIEALRKAASRVKKILVVEDCQGQLVEDVECVIQGKVPVHLLGIWGRHLPGMTGVIYPERILQEVKNLR